MANPKAMVSTAQNFTKLSQRGKDYVEGFMRGYLMQKEQESRKRHPPNKKTA